MMHSNPQYDFSHISPAETRDPAWSMDPADDKVVVRKKFSLYDYTHKIGKGCGVMLYH